MLFTWLQVAGLPKGQFQEPITWWMDGCHNGVLSLRHLHYFSCLASSGSILRPRGPLVLKTLFWLLPLLNFLWSNFLKTKVCLNLRIFLCLSLEPFFDSASQTNFPECPTLSMPASQVFEEVQKQVTSGYNCSQALFFFFLKTLVSMRTFSWSSKQESSSNACLCSLSSADTRTIWTLPALRRVRTQSSLVHSFLSLKHRGSRIPPCILAPPWGE